MIRGVLLPIITPFDEKVRVDEQLMRQLVDFHIGAGVQGLFVLGSTGQGPAMTMEERKQAAAIALDQAKSRVPVVIHVGTADAGSTVELAEHAAAHKADAVAIVPPYYYSDHTEYEIIAHYKAVAKAVPLPIFIYENPKYSGISIPPGLAVRMKEQVPALKGNQSRLWPGSVARIRTAIAGRFRLHRQRGSLWARAFRPSGDDQSADQLCAGALRRVVHRPRRQRLRPCGGSAEKSRYRCAPGGGAIAQVWARSSARGFSHARLPSETFSQMGDGADAQRRGGQAGARVERRRYSGTVSAP